MATKSKFKKKEIYCETYAKGIFYTRREQVSGWALNPDVWLEIKNAGNNEDGTEFVTIKFNNLKPPTK